LTTISTERDDLIHRLREQFATDEARKFGLTMVEGEIQKEADWWHVPVSSGVANVNAFDYSPILNRIEEEFESRGTKLLLIPALAD